MTRSVDTIEGLALLGAGRVGPLAFPVPAVLLPRPDVGAPMPEGFALTVEPARSERPGRRALYLSDRAGRVAIEFAIPTPEVSGVPGAAEEAGPGIWFVHWPLAPADAVRLSAARPELVVLGNARALLAEGRPFVESLAELRTLAGAGALLWAPRVALPHRLALLAYLGVDLLDATEAIARSRSGAYLDRVLGETDEALARQEESCRCPACRSDPPGSREAHALELLLDELRLVRASARSGRLRELVEARLTAEPLLAEMLRYADLVLGPRLDERIPVVGAGSRSYVLRESHRRPEIRRFRSRLLERYRPPGSKEVLLVVPCSRTKPYRNSRSHRRMMGAAEGLTSLERLHVVSVTSPLGLVPKELEDTFPARHYDIPVTGEWDEDERASVVAPLRHVLTYGRYRHVIFHLDPDEYRFLREVDAPAVWTLADHRSTSPAALGSLRRALSDALEGRPPVAGGPLTVVREELAEVAAFQFGRAAAERLFAPPVRLAGRPWFQRVTDGAGTDLATWREMRGLFHLTVAGAARMLSAHPLEVEVDAHVELRGDLFAPGVVRADPAIRVGDAVVLVRAGALLAVGEATLPGPLMTELRRGLAVNVRHRVPGLLAPAPPTST